MGGVGLGMAEKKKEKQHKTIKIQHFRAFEEEIAEKGTSRLLMWADL